MNCNERQENEYLCFQRSQNSYDDKLQIEFYYLRFFSTKRNQVKRNLLGKYQPMTTNKHMNFPTLCFYVWNIGFASARNRAKKRIKVCALSYKTCSDKKTIDHCSRILNARFMLRIKRHSTGAHSVSSVERIIDA